MDDSTLPRFMRSTNASRNRSSAVIIPAPTPKLVEETAAVVPNLDILTAAVSPNLDNILANEVAARLAARLKILVNAAETLTHDIQTFLRHRLQTRQRAETMSFVRAAVYYGRDLIFTTARRLIDHLCRLPAVYDGGDLIFTTPRRLIDPLCRLPAEVNTLIVELDNLHDAVEKEGWDFDWPSTTTTIVPTGSPYQYLHQALLPDVRGDTTPAEILCK